MERGQFISLLSKKEDVKITEKLLTLNQENR
jgi:hypothetical protein